MLKHFITQFILALCLFAAPSAMAETGDLFTVNSSGQLTGVPVTIELCLNGLGPLSCERYNISASTVLITTTEPSFLYTEAGIKVLTPGYEITPILSGINCVPYSNGYCIFSVSDTIPQIIEVSTNPNYSLSGSISGLLADGLIIVNQGITLNIPINATSFQFPIQYNALSSYNITIQQQPITGQCSVTHGSGQFTSNVNDVIISCVTPRYSISGNTNATFDTQVLSINLFINGVLQDSTHPNSGDYFNFQDAAIYNDNFLVTVTDIPNDQFCSVSPSASGTIAYDDIYLTVDCSNNSYIVSGTCSTTAGPINACSGVSLLNNGTDSITLSADGSFEFPAIAITAPYEVTIDSDSLPPGVSCVIPEPSSGNHSSYHPIQVNCSKQTFSISGTVSNPSNLSIGDGTLALYNTANDDKNFISAADNSTFILEEQVPFGEGYNLILDPDYSIQNGTCTFSSNATGDNVTSPVTGIVITCIPTTPSTTTLSSSINPSIASTSPEFTAQVTSSDGVPPEGSVQFSVNGVDQGPPTLLVNGSASFSYLFQDPGDNYPIGAVYLPSNSDTHASSSTVFYQSVVNSTVLVATSPAQPLNVIVTPILGNNSVDVSWTPPANTGGSTITSYSLYSGSSTAPLVPNIHATDISVGSLVPGDTYQFRITATNAQGEGPAGYASAFTFRTPILISPASLALSGLDSAQTRALTVTNNSNTSGEQCTLTSVSTDGLNGAEIFNQPNACFSGKALSPGESCTVSIDPTNLTSVPCANGTAPEPSTLTVNFTCTSGGGSLTAPITFLSYNCLYQGGYVFSIDDTTPSNTSIGGKVAMRYNGGGIQWSAIAADPYLGTIYPRGVTQASTIALPSFNQTLAGPINYLNCNGANDGFCNTFNSINAVKYWANIYPSFYMAAPKCAQMTNTYPGWYLTALCELTTNTTYCATGQDNVIQNAPAMSANTTYLWSSTQYSGNNYDAWRVEKGTPAAKSMYDTGSDLICARALTP
jgi:hypothetical protein